VSKAGNFFGSTLVQLRGSDPPPQSLSLVAGLAVAEAVDAALPAQPLMLKWPNDLLLAGSKLAGILLERSGDRVVVGFGVNLASAPELPGRECTSLSGAIAPPAFAPLLAASFAGLVDLWRRKEPHQVAQAWLARAHPIGTPLSVHASPGDLLHGKFDGLEPDGALRLRRTDGTIEIIRAGDVGLG
jgi:BirA family biotin operon repressor/biotin-[acetyl-CoA-carboxylase] ligase